MKKQKIYTKKEAIDVISQSAKLYHDNLENKSILILAKNGKKIDAFQIDFSSTNFQHFTGTTTDLRAIDFYDAALHNNLRENDFRFNNNLLTSMKLDVLKNVVLFHQTAKMIGNYIGDHIELKADVGAGNVCYVLTCRYKIGKKNILYPVGVQKEDARNTTSKKPIIAIFRKKHGKPVFDEITYKSKNININKLHIPFEIKKLISPTTFTQLQSLNKISDSNASSL